MAGCSSVSFFVHEPTHDLIRSPVDAEDINGSSYTVEGVLFVPDFTKLTESYNTSSGGFRLYSSEPTEIYIDRVEVRVPGSEVDILEFKQIYTLDRVTGDINYQVLPIFSSKTTARQLLEKYWSTSLLDIEIFFSFKDRDTLNSLRFNLVKKTRYGPAWPT